MNKFKSLILLFIFIIVLIPAVNIYADETPVYNYKLSFENDTGFSGGGYTYCGGNSGDGSELDKMQIPNTPPKPGMTTTSATDGKFGKAWELTYHGFHIISGNQKGGAAFVRPLSDSISLGSGTDNIRNYMQSVRNVCFWARAPYSPNIPANGQRNFQIKFQTKLTDKNEYGDFISMTFEAWANVKNTGEWQYIKLPISSFKSGDSFFTSYSSKVASYDLMVTIPYGNDYFGHEPGIETFENPWIEPLYIDEMIFDRSLVGKPAITIPSVGEEQNYVDASLSSFKVDDVLCDDVEITWPNKNKDIYYVSLPISKKYNDENIKDIKIEGIPTCETSSGSDVAPYSQVRTGSKVEWMQGETIADGGEFYVLAADGKTDRIYKVSFYTFDEFKSPLTLEGVTGSVNITRALTQGTKNDVDFKIKNNSENEQNIIVIAVLRDVNKGTVLLTTYVNGYRMLNERGVMATAWNKSIPANETVTMRLPPFTIPTITKDSKYELTFYFFDNLNTGRSLLEPITVRN